MRMLAKPFLALAAVTLLTVAGSTLAPAFAEETAPAPGAVTAPADPAAVAPDATGETESEVAPDSATGTVEEPAYSPMPAEGPGGGCRHRAVQVPSA